LTRHRYAEEYNRQAKEYDQRALTIVSSYPAMLSHCNAARSLLGDDIAEQVEQLTQTLLTQCHAVPLTQASPSRCRS
jgi:hypothetical protein